MQHRDLLQALAMRDGSWAESTMRSHILAGRATLLDTIDQMEGDPGQTDAD
jgi:DNA-binding FadR family transcriptional regulator